MWPITAWDVIHLRQGAGDRLTALMDDLIRNECLYAAIPLAAVHSNLRANLGDQGVDTRVASAALGEQTGWLRELTIWQYKAVAHPDVAPQLRRNEIEKEYAAQCIREGYAYRFVIADDLPAATKQRWEDDFTTWTHGVAQNARTPMVLGAGDIAAWANRYPPVIAKHFAHRIAAKAVHLVNWGPSITSLTPDYVRVPEWADTETALRAHCDPLRMPAEAVFTIQGEAGVGKTRLSYESLRAIPEGQLVVYTLDPMTAVELAYRLANDATLRAIVVADECDVESRYRIRAILQGHRARVRVIAIDNTGVRTPQSAAPEYWLESVPENVVEAVLTRNYPEVPQDRRRAYASLAGGFITLAADLCRNDATVVGHGGVHNLPAGIYDYYRLRLQEVDRAALETLALVRNVGYSDDRAEELVMLCAVTGQDPQQVREFLLRLHDVPGFVGRGGRLLYVTPQAIAQVAFGNAWTRWVSHDPAAFLKRIPAALLDGFLERVKSTAATEVRDIVAEYFRAWLETLTPDALTDVEHVERLATLAETNPLQVLPIIRRLVDHATSEQLLAGSADPRGGWGPRRKLVWLCENLARFQSSFFDSERILLRLALHETERNVGNNATGVWTGFYKIVRSGTPVPFLERITLLREQLRSRDAATVSLGLNAVQAALDPHGLGLVPPPLIGGQITPREWRPESRQEALECERAAFRELAEIIEARPAHRDQAVGIALDRLYMLVGDGLMDECRRVLRPEHMSAERLAELINTIERLLARDLRVDPGDRLPVDVVAQLRGWAAELKPHGLHERLVTAVAVDPWRKERDETGEDWRAELATLADRLVNDLGLALEELPWLLSRAARASADFGEHVGQLDSRGQLLDQVLGAATAAQDLGFVRGYLSGLLRSHANTFAVRVNTWLDSIEQQSPQTVYEISVSVPDAVSGFDRLIRLVANEQLSGAHLRAFGLRRQRSQLELTRMLTVLVERAKRGDTQSTEAALDIIGGWLHRDSTALEAASPETLALLWSVGELGSRDPGQEAYEWLNLMLALSARDSARGAQLAANALVSEQISHHDEADQVFAQAAARDAAGAVNDIETPRVQ